MAQRRTIDWTRGEREALRRRTALHCTARGGDGRGHSGSDRIGSGPKGTVEASASALPGRERERTFRRTRAGLLAPVRPVDVERAEASEGVREHFCEWESIRDEDEVR